MKRALIAVVLAGSCGLASAEPVVFVNDGSLVWRAAPPATGQDPYACVSAFDPSEKRAFDITLGPAQTQPAVIGSQHFCMRNVSLGGFTGIFRGSMYGVGIATLPHAPFDGGFFGVQQLDAVRGFAPGELVGPDQIYTNAPNISYRSGGGLNTTSGALVGDMQYVGVRFELNGNTHYGWMLVDFASMRNYSAVNPNPIAWGYESEPNTPVRIEFGAPYSPIRTASRLRLESVRYDFAGPAIAEDPTPRYFAGPSVGEIPGGITPQILDAAQTGALSLQVTPASSWLQNARWVADSAPSLATTAVYSIGFRFDPGFTAANATQGQLELSFVTADKLGSPTQPGGYLNGQPLSGLLGVGSATTYTTLTYADVRANLHAGTNTLALYSVNQGAAVEGAGLAFFAYLDADYRSMAVNPPAPQIPVNSTAQLYAAVRGGNSTAVTWSSSGGTVSSSGLFSAAAPGTFTVTATVVGEPGRSASTTVTVDPVPCAADFNHDGELNPDDLGDYINCYFAQPPCPDADFNHDTTIDPDDLGDFINEYFNGCS